MVGNDPDVQPREIYEVKGATSNQAALAMHNACVSKFRNVVAVRDFSFLGGCAAYAPPDLQVSINNRAAFA
jgi:hypothetical protein